jgi:hypothetical protein
MQNTKFSQDIKNDVAAMVGGMMDRLGMSIQIADDDLEIKVQNLAAGKTASAGGWVYTNGKHSVELNISEDHPMSTVLHEWGHILAGLTNQDDLFGKQLREWYNDNASGQPKAGDQFGVAHKDTHRKLSIKDSLIKVPHWYSAKTTGREMESTFWEYLFLNPAKLAKDCPDFVKLILEMMKK